MQHAKFKLRTTFLSPDQSAYQGRTSLVCPDGYLAILNFETLVSATSLFDAVPRVFLRCELLHFIGRQILENLLGSVKSLVILAHMPVSAYKRTCSD